MARLFGASFAILLIAALAAISFAYPALFPNRIELPAYDIDPAEGKANLDSTVALELRGSVSREDVLRSLAIEPAPLRWMPDVEVQHIARLPWHEGFDWAKTRILINPSERQVFEPETTYSVTLDGKPVLEFETITLPRVIGARATEIDPDGSGKHTTSSSIVILFNERIVWNGRFLQIQPSADVSFHMERVSGGRTELWVTPETRWKNETTYTLSVARGVQDVYGHSGVEPFTYAFDTWPPPAILATGPVHDSTPPDTAVVVNFDRDADRRRVEQSFRIEPAVDGEFVWPNDRTFTFQPDALNYSTRYTVSVAGKADGGDSIPETVWSFETQDPPVSVEVQGSLEGPAILTAKASGGLGTYEFEWSSGEKDERVLAVAPPGQTREMQVTVRSGDQTATASVQVKGHAPVPCPRGWETIETSVCYRRETLPGPVQVHMTRVDARDLAINLRSLPANGTLGHPATVSESARAHGSLVSINGDFFQMEQASYYPMGPLMSGGRLLYKPSSDEPVLALDAAANPWVGAGGDFPARTQLHYADFAVGGSHILLRNGKPLPLDNELAGLQPRTAIGVDAAGFVYLVTVDGRSQSSVGMTLTDLQGYLRGLGVQDAINLDGGGSATMAIRGRVVNSPSGGQERPIATVVEALRR